MLVYRRVPPFTFEPEKSLDFWGSTLKVILGLDVGDLCREDGVGLLGGSSHDESKWLITMVSFRPLSRVVGPLANWPFYGLYMGVALTTY